MQQALNPFRSALQISNLQSAYSSPNWSAEQFDICIEEGVPIISTAFGCLSREQMTIAKNNRLKLSL
ncbi:hypothetical protein B481_2923 [Planococcus halocryophilus Or1]|nr:hypothetical protein B481_2923 [Planococcus halocryophilus Or1]